MSGVDDAWTELCRTLERAGTRIRADDFPAGPTARAEGYRHLTRLLVHGLQWHLEFGDPDFPRFYRTDDDVVKWGGPNVDNHYLRAKVEPSGTYRVRADVRGLRECIVSVHEGEMALGAPRVLAERSLADMEVVDGRLEILLGPKARGHRNAMPLPDGADHVLVRQYVHDWEHDAVAVFHIERIGREGDAPAPVDADRVTGALVRAGAWVERSVDYWNTYMRMLRERGADNVLSPPRAVAAGAADILYGGGWWSLAPGEALLVDFAVPRARYWSMQLYSAPWFESLDVVHRVNSVNDAQAVVGDDGVVRVVVSAEDPQVPNWLDTEGRPDGMVSYRWVWSQDAPAPTTRVVPLTDVQGTFGLDARRAQRRARRDGITRRFRR